MAGYFAAYRYASQKHIDIALHLGDYIYELESSNLKKIIHSINHWIEIGPKGRIHEPENTLLTLKDYRTRHAQYKTDPDLQLIHERVAFMTIWDDHEIVDNYWKDGPDDQSMPWTERKAAAIQAYFEYMPIRQIDINDTYRIYRTFRYGKLADLSTLLSFTWWFTIF